MKKKFKTVPNWLLGLVITLPLLAGMLSEYPPLHALDLKAYNLLSRLRQRDMPSPVVIVEIDRKSIAELGSWPWPRSYMADIITIISTAQAKAIGLNILYQSEDHNPALAEIKQIRTTLANVQDSEGHIALANDLLGKVGKRIDYDSLLTSAVKPAPNVVLPLKFAWLGRTPEPQEIPGWLTKNNIAHRQDPLIPKQLMRELHHPLLVLKASTPPPTNMQVPFRALASVASRYGHINHSPDHDETIRRGSLAINYQNQLFPSLALQMAMAYDDHKFPDIKLIRTANINKAIQYGNKRLPISHDFNMLLDYHDSPFVISRFSFSDVLAGKTPKGILDNKLVLIGITDPDFTRIYHTPLGLDKSGVELTADTVANIVNNSFIQRPGWAWLLESLILLYFGMILLYITERLGTKTSLMLLATFLCVWWGITAFLFINNGMWFYIAPHTLAVCLGFSLQRLNHRQVASEKKIDEHTEMNKMLGLSFQAQGLLDMSFDSFRKCSLNDASVKEALYNLALDFERKRMANKSVSVYEYLLKGGKYKDAHERIWRLKRADAKALGSAAQDNNLENTVLYNNDNAAIPTLGRYEVVKEIGQGAIGTVYLGRDPKINRKVAIKTLRYDQIDGEQLAEVKERFFREAEAAGRLSHPNIVTIYDAGEDYDITYMAMEYLDGHDLARHCKKTDLLPIKVILNIIIRVAFALDYAHKHKVVHRDIKPANIMLTEKGHVKVTDFGIARLTSADSTQTGVILGTPNYMSPEQVLGKKLDGRSDIFSLGAVFYELLTGEKPFKSANIGNLMHNIASAKFQPVKELRPDTPPCCEEIIQKMMTKSRTNRFSTAGEVVIKAQQCLGNL